MLVHWRVTTSSLCQHSTQMSIMFCLETSTGYSSFYCVHCCSHTWKCQRSPGGFCESEIMHVLMGKFSRAANTIFLAKLQNNGWCPFCIVYNQDDSNCLMFAAPSHKPFRSRNLQFSTRFDSKEEVIYCFLQERHMLACSLRQSKKRRWPLESRFCCCNEPLQKILQEIFFQQDMKVQIEMSALRLQFLAGISLRNLHIAIAQNAHTFRNVLLSFFFFTCKGRMRG